MDFKSRPGLNERYRVPITASQQRGFFFFVCVPWRWDLREDGRQLKTCTHVSFLTAVIQYQQSPAQK